MLGTIGYRVTILGMTPQAMRGSYDNESFEVVYIDPVATTSHARLKPLRIASNLTWQKARSSLREKTRGCFGALHMRAALINQSPDAIHSVDATTLQAACGVSSTLEIPFVYDAYEFWPDHALEQACQLSPRQRRLIVQLERECIQKAAAVITVSDYLARLYQVEYDLDHTPTTIYNAPLVQQVTKSPVHNPLEFVFIGNLQEERNLRMLFEAAANEPRINLTFQGDGPLKKWLTKQIQARNLCERIKVCPPVAYRSLSQSLAGFDVGIICHKPYNRQMEGALPNKFFDYLGAGLAVVVPLTPAFEQFCDIKKYGVFIDTTNRESIMRMFADLSTDPAFVQRLKTNASCATGSHSPKRQTNRLATLYRELFR
jgi:glycosyltransferase involved in cell wall biosynthesis